MAAEKTVPEPPTRADARRRAARYLDRWERHISLTASNVIGDAEDGTRSPGDQKKPAAE